MDIKNSPELLLKETMQLEMRVGELYLLFAELFPEDAPLWNQLHKEEENHATLLESIRGSLAVVDDHTLNLLASSVEDVQNTNAELTALIKTFRDTPPLRAIAFQTAIGIEDSAGEKHYQIFMSGRTKTPVEGIFRQLNKDDKNHAERIRAYMKEKTISLPDDHQA